MTNGLFVSFYIALGWVAVIAAKPLFDAMSAEALVLLVVGGGVVHGGRFVPLVEGSAL